MYGNTISSGAKWFFFGFVGIVLMAIFLGMDLQKATWLNREIAAADARAKNVETTYKEQQYQLSVEREKARLEAERQRLEAERETQKALDSQGISNRQVAFNNWMKVLTWLGGAISVSIIIGTILWFGSKALILARTVPSSPPSIDIPIKTVAGPTSTVSERKPYDPWYSEEYRRSKIKEARYLERASRKTELGRGRNKMPLAE